MKKLLFIASFMVVGLMLHVGIGFAYFMPNAEEGQGILARFEREKSKSDSNNDWKPTGPTAEDIRSATKVENLAAKGSPEDKLISAVKNGDLKNVKTFIAAGAGLEARDDGNMTALMRAAEKGYSDIVRILIDAGADVNAKDRFNCTALFKAADKNHVDVVKMLLAKGVPIDSTFKDIFVSSAFKGNVEMIKAFIESARISDDILNAACMVVRYNSEVFNVIEKALNKESQ